MRVSRIYALVSIVIPRCALPSLSYPCEVADDGSVLAGVELELPGDGSAPVPRRDFFSSLAWCGFMNGSEQAAL